MFENDMIVRAIQAFAAAIARAMGFVRAEEYEEAIEAVRAGEGALPIVPGLLDQMDAEALFQLLGPEQSRTLAELSKVEADAWDGLKQPARAEQLRRRARQLELWATASIG